MNTLGQILLISTCINATLLGQDEAVGIFRNATDVGKPSRAGSSTYDPATQVYTMKGGGYNIWFERDEFQYAYQSIKGDFIITANFEFVGEGIDPHRKFGWMVRESLDDEAAHVSAVAHGDGLTVLQWRELRGAYMRDPQDEIFAPKSGYSILQLERRGQEIVMRAAHPGETLQLIGSKKMEDLGESVFAGAFVCSHNPEVVEEAKIWNARIDRPAPEAYNPYQSGFLGSRLETMNVFNGKRRVIHEALDGLEAPNWLPNSESLIFNAGGSIYSIPAAGGSVRKLDTGFANRINNDHGISFDGRLLAISHNGGGASGDESAIYILPIEGGEPRLVTKHSPSYWHGWNPNNQEVSYVAKRSKDAPYNIFRSSIEGGKEIPVTDFKSGHVDGPEYSPDGKYIYYNGSQSGTMQIWRIKPDGSEAEQLTFDHYNKWFPHLSPDGKWMVYISFSADIPVDSHPAYKRVTLNLAPASGGPSKVIAYLYGGQGTINVPSWASDSKRIAFVSNSGQQ